MNDLWFLRLSRRLPDTMTPDAAIRALKYLSVELDVAVVAMSTLKRKVEGHPGVKCFDSNNHKEVDDQKIEEYTQFALLLKIWNGPIRKLIIPIKRVT